MYNLIINEWIKGARKQFIILSIIIISISCVFLGIITKNLKVQNNNIDFKWRENLQNDNKHIKENIEDPKQENQYKERMKLDYNINSYLLEHNIPPSDWRQILVSQLLILQSSNNSNDKILAQKTEEIIKNKDWRRYLSLIDENVKSDMINYGKTSYQYKEAQIRLKENKLRYKYDIEPIISSKNWKDALLKKWTENSIRILRNEYFFAEKQDYISDTQVKNFENENKVILYRLANNVPEVNQKSFAGCMSQSFKLNLIIIVIIIIFATRTIVSEFSYGTASQLFTYPYKRWKILFSKYILVSVISLLFLVLLYFISMIISGMFFEHQNIPAHLSLHNDKVVKLNYLVYMIIKYLLIFIEINIYISILFMFSLLVRNSGIVIGISTLILVVVQPILIVLSQDYKVKNLKYIPLASFDLNQFFEGNILISGLTIKFAIIMIIFSVFIVNGINYFLISSSDI